MTIINRLLFGKQKNTPDANLRKVVMSYGAMYTTLASPSNIFVGPYAHNSSTNIEIVNIFSTNVTY